MSRLRELRLHGFKTFADPTLFVFEPGVNAVIGPNGSGKSNMADAVRWVLGEQSNRSLRTRRADDVIFAGSQQRKPQGMAEAILTLDNADGWLPIEFAEVSIGRRAYRSGESEYLINGARARLRDVVELLGEGRLGANELVVVGQGTVDSALSLRPEERRQLFEEAAGVKNLQVRKNEALARLGKARDNLTRITDLIAELKPQVRRLGLQAQHAQEHDSLVTRARALVLEAHRRREAAERQALGDARRRAAAAEAALEEQRSAAEANRRSMAEAEEAYWRADAGSREAAVRHEATREAVVRSESALEAVSRRLDEAASAIRAAEGELAVTASTPEARAQPDADDDSLTRAVTTAAAAEAAWQAASNALAELDLALLAAEERLAETRHRAGLRIADAARREEQSARAVARREELEQELEAARREAEAAGDALPSLRADAAAAGESAGEARTAHEAALAAIVEAQPLADAARRRASELAEKAGAMRGELEALQERAEGRGRLGSILSAAGWQALLDGIDAPDEAWPAVEAIVGGELEQALLWQDDELAGRLLDARGSARLLANGDAAGDAPSGPARAEALAAIGADRTLAEWIGGERLPVLFRWTAVVPDVQTLLGAWRRLPAGWLAVTPAGDMADARGLLVLHGRAESNGSAAARRHGRRRELAQALEAIDSDQAAAAGEAARAMAAVTEAGRRLDDARARRDAADSDERTTAAALESAELRAERVTTAASRIADELATIAVNEPDARQEVATSADDELPSLEREVTSVRERRAAAAAERSAAREAWTAAQAAAREIEDRQLGADRSRAVEAARRMQAESAIAAQQAGRARLTAERAELEAGLGSARESDQAAAAAREAADAERDGARAALVALEREVGEVRRLGELEREAQAAAIEASRHEEALAALSRERELALDSLPQPGPSETDEGDQPALPAVAPDAPSEELVAELTGMDDETLDGELRRVRRTLSQIGSVNPFAVEEHRELSARLDDLTTQDTDLGGAIAGTEELIAQLDVDITSRFNAAFAAIGERFDDFCRLLFAGGSASLQLGDGEDGEAPGGIEIVVRPPGKRLQRLAMLSGGERALTGVALLFAMLSVNPVPFCILDEVDAALDEANIGRFADALRRLSEDIDFVVITHNRATIEVADTIYGVTMDDAAVSAVVSLRLADIPAEVPIG